MFYNSCGMTTSTFLTYHTYARIVQLASYTHIATCTLPSKDSTTSDSSSSNAADTCKEDVHVYVYTRSI